VVGTISGFNLKNRTCSQLAATNFRCVAAPLEQSRQPIGRLLFRGKKETYERLFETEVS
jgi:hypothetical protein